MNKILAGTSTLAIVVAAASYAQTTTSKPAASQPAAQRVIQAGQFDIVNVRGDVVASITALPQAYPGVLLRFGTHQSWTTQIYAMGGNFAAQQEDGTGRYKAALMLSASLQQAYFCINDAKTKSAIQLGIDEKGEPYISRSGKDGEWRVPTTRPKE